MMLAFDKLSRLLASLPVVKSANAVAELSLLLSLPISLSL